MKIAGASLAVIASALTLHCAPTIGAEPAAPESGAVEAEQEGEKKRGGMVRRPRRTPSPETRDSAPKDDPAPEQAVSTPEAVPDSAPPQPAPELAASPDMTQGARVVPLDPGLFRPDPAYSGGYDPDQQLELYGGKRGLDPPRPLLELGYLLYHEGRIGESQTFLGAKNPVKQQFLLYGDWRTSAALNDNGIAGGDGETANGLVASRLNLEFDWKLTGTERIHFLLRPLDRDGRFARYEFQGAGTPDGTDDEVPANGNVVVGFLEGDLGAIGQGMSGYYNTVDLPFAVGLIPMLFQNGTWVDDAFSGLAFTIPAMNSPALDISNMDLTFFAGADRVSLPGVLDIDDRNGRVVGAATFIETWSGYFEAGIGYLMADRDATFDQSFFSTTMAFTRRYGGWLSNSIRFLGAFGQEAPPGGGLGTADGVLLLIENSLITSRPYTLVPYFNLFVGIDSPQSLARDPGAGGILSNTGINFESDSLTGFPTLDPTAREAVGGALGLEYLFNLDQQLVVEVATVQRTADAPGDTSDFGIGVRYQVPFWKRFILRADGMIGALNQGNSAVERDVSGLRIELRAKF